MSETRRMTVAQALVEFLAHQWTVDGDHRERTVPEMFGIFGHGNVAGVGQALRQLAVTDHGMMPYHHARNEQAMVHQAVGFARMRRRRATFAATSSVGPGATNMITGAALATTNRLPALLLPSDTFATRVADPVLQQVELPWDTSVTVNDAFRPVSKYFDRVQRPEQLFSIALNAMRVLTDPVETGAVTIALPEDVQAEALDVPLEFLAVREWHLRRPGPDARELERAVTAIRAAKAPVLIAGGGVLYATAERVLADFVAATGIPVAATQAGVGSLPWDDPRYLGGAGATGSTAANRLLREADLIIGVGTRYSDFTTGSNSAFANPDVTFVNVNVASFDAHKLGSRFPLVADARITLEALLRELHGWTTPEEWTARAAEEKRSWDATVTAATTATNAAVPGQAEVIGAVWEAAGAKDVVVQAAGSLPGDLHKLWRVRDPLGYHVEYAYSTMGYEIAGGMGVARAVQREDDHRDVIVLVGDGSYLMLSSELATIVAEGLKVVIVLVQNHGYASIGHLSETVGSERFGTEYRYYDATSPSFVDERLLPIDLAMNARSYGIDVVDIPSGPNAAARLRDAVVAAKLSSSATLIQVNTDPRAYAPDGEGWWDVPVAAVARTEATTAARTVYERERLAQRRLLG